MVKVLYNGEYIELEDEIEKGAKELDMITEENDLEDTKEFNIDLDFENTYEYDFSSLEDTKEYIMEDKSEL